MLLPSAHAAAEKACVGIACSALLTLNWPDLAGYMLLGGGAAQVARLFVQEVTHGTVKYRAWPHFAFGAIVGLAAALLFDGQTPQRLALMVLLGGFCSYPILAVTYRLVPERWRQWLAPNGGGQ